MEVVDVQSVIAAILTVGALDNTGHTAEFTVKKYIDVLQALQAVGGHREPRVRVSPRS